MATGSPISGGCGDSVPAGRVDRRFGGRHRCQGCCCPTSVRDVIVASRRCGADGHGFCETPEISIGPIELLCHSSHPAESG
jgi:hypothetical protein